MRLVQWNVWHREQAHHLVSVLQQLSADVLCLQEVTTDSPTNPGIDIPDMLARALRMHVTFLVTNHATWRRGQIILGNAILSRWPIRRVRHAFVRFPSRTKKGGMREGRLYLEAEIRGDTKPCTIGTAHLSHRFEATQPEQAAEMRLLLSEIAHHEQRYVLAGDFNRSPVSPDMRTIEQRLVHCGPSYDDSTWIARHPFLSRMMRKRLDYVFATRDVTVQDARILNVSASDHDPILVDLTF